MIVFVELFCNIIVLTVFVIDIDEKMSRSPLPINVWKLALTAHRQTVARSL